MTPWKIYAILVLVMVVWGFNLPAVKFLLEYMEPVTLSAFRILLAGISVFVILAFTKLIRLPSKHEWKYIFAGAFLNVLLHHYFLSIALSITSGTNAGLILGAGPMLTAVLVSLILRSYPSKLQWIGVIVGLAGVSATVLVGGGETASMNIGDLFVFIAILAQVFSYIVITKAAKTLDPRLLTAYMLVIGSLFLFITAVIQEPGEMAVFAQVPGSFWLAFLFSAIIGTAVGHMLYNYSVGQAGPTKAAIFINLNTLVSLLGANLLLGETITSRHLFGLVLIVIGVILGSGAAEDIWMKRKRKLAQQVAEKRL